MLQALCYLLPFPLRHLRTKPYTPPTNGKAERFIQISLYEWAYARSYEGYGQRVQHPDALAVSLAARQFRRQPSHLVRSISLPVTGQTTDPDQQNQHYSRS